MFVETGVNDAGGRGDDTDVVDVGILDNGDGTGVMATEIGDCGGGELDNEG